MDNSYSMLETQQLVVNELLPDAKGVNLEQTTLPDTVPNDCLRVKILASPINPADLNYVAGTYGDTPELPAPVGMEGCGEVVSTTDAENFPEGSKVFFTDRAGSWAEYVDVPSSAVLPLPENIDPLQAALLKVNPMTALRLLKDFVTLEPGSWVIQNAANSSVGECVIQIAKQLGLRTANVVRREGLEESLTALGADAVFIDDAELKSKVLEVTGSQPALGLNAVGGDSALRMMDTLAPRGTMVTYGAMSRMSLKVPNSFLIFKQLRLDGFWVTKWIAAQSSETLATEYAQLAEWIAQGVLRSSIDTTYPLQDFRAALDHAAQDKRAGKILFTP